MSAVAMTRSTASFAVGCAFIGLAAAQFLLRKRPRTGANTRSAALYAIAGSIFLLLSIER